MRKLNIFRCAVLIYTTLVLVSCNAERKNDVVDINQSNIDTTLALVVNQQIIPTVEKFSSQVILFNEDINTFCSQKDLANLQVIKNDWQQLMLIWYRLAIYNFGPLDDDVIFPRYIFIDSLRLRGTDYLQTVRSEITKQIIGTDVLSTSYFDNLTFQKVGLLALESLIFETASGEHSNNINDILIEYTTTPRKCEVLAGIAKQLEKQANYVKNGWLNTHLNTNTPYKNIFLNNQLADGSLPTSKLLVTIQAHLDYLQKRNVVSVAASLADYSWQSVEASIDEVEELLTGEQLAGKSYFALMNAAGFQNSVAMVKENISRVRIALAAQDESLLAVELGKLDGNFKRDIPDALAIQLGINFTDGD